MNDTEGGKQTEHKPNQTKYEASWCEYHDLDFVQMIQEINS